MWVCWYSNDLNKQKSFPLGKNNFSSCSFSFFFTFASKQHQYPLPLQVQSHGRRGRDEVLLSVSHQWVCSVCENPNRRSYTWGCLPWGDHAGMSGTMATAPSCGREQGQARRRGSALGRGWCPGAASLLSSGGDDPLSSWVGGGWSFLLESAQWAIMDLGRLPQKCIFMKFQTQSAPKWWKHFWKPQVSFRKSLIDNILNFCIIFNSRIILFHRITESLR